MQGSSECGRDCFCNLTSKDVVRHPLVQKIVQAYEVYEAKEQKREQKDAVRRAEDKTKNRNRRTR